MNHQSPPIPDVLDVSSLRGLLFLGFFGTLITAKCSASEALRLHYDIAINSALFIWLPSLVLGGLVCLLYIAGPGSRFHPYWRSRHFLIPAALIWVTAAFSIVRQLPSVIVPGSLCILFAVGAFVLGHFYRSIPVKFLAAVWIFGAIICLFVPPVGSFSLFAILLVGAGALPTGYAYFQIGRAEKESATATARD